VNFQIIKNYVANCPEQMPRCGVGRGSKGGTKLSEDFENINKNVFSISTEKKQILTHLALGLSKKNVWKNPHVVPRWKKFFRRPCGTM